MKTLSTILAVATLCLPLAASATPKSDMIEFQAYFHKRFPKVPFRDYVNGVYAMPAAKGLRAQWEQIMQFPPYTFGLDRGKKLWNTPFRDGNTYASCFKNGGVGIATGYPYWDPATKEVRTLVMDINTCRMRNGAAPYKNVMTGPMADLDAYVKHLSYGKPVAVQINSPGAVQAYEAGKRFFWARRGQLNFSCATCHVEHAGQHLRGNVISAALGHGTGFPAFRSKWGTLGTLAKRYRGCNKKVDAAPFKPLSVQYRDLEFYQMYMNTGLPLSAPSQRP
ncbi:MAG TPA: sulfur oxidation c-type cytochrome SoxA [Acidiferrobacter sp.]|nr:sulfur oxidation c-type cytochrome SoxA [Acidiferrobacter sp.]